MVCVTYYPAEGFSGTVSFCLQVCDNGIPQLCDTAMVTVKVACPEFQTWMATLKECATSVEGNPKALFTLTEADGWVTTGNPSGH